jgi:hypothetical protein
MCLHNGENLDQSLVGHIGCSLIDTIFPNVSDEPAASIFIKNSGGTRSSETQVRTFQDA